MSGGINQVGFDPAVHQSQTPDVPQGKHDGVTVQSRGQTIQTQPSQQSLIQQAMTDSAEEVTMAFQDKSADRLKRRDAKSKSASRINEILEKYLKHVSAAKNAEKFGQLAESMKQLSKPDPQQIRDLLDEFHDGSDGEDFESGILLALEEIFSADEAGSDVLAAIREVKAELGEELKSFYQTNVKSYEGVTDVYDQLLGEHGEEDFLAATDALITRLGEDLHAEGTAADSTKIKSTVDSLYHLEVARNTFTSFANLMQKMQATFTQGTV